MFLSVICGDLRLTVGWIIVLNGPISRTDDQSSQHSPAASSPLQAAPPAVSLGRRLELLARAVFINRNFALLWWGQAISNVGDYAWDTALVLWVASFLVAGQS
jgi:hypothetical protein